MSGALERLDDYLSASGSDADAATYEDDLFDRAASGQAPELAWRSAARATVRQLADRGTLQPGITPRQLERMQKSGLRVRIVEIAGTRGEQRMVIPRDADIVVTRYPLDLRGIRRVEIETVLHEFGVERRGVVPDIPFDPASGLLLCCEGDLARSGVGILQHGKFWGIDESGKRRLLAETSFAPELD